jgi:hypothetical protein
MQQFAFRNMQQFAIPENIHLPRRKLEVNPLRSSDVLKCTIIRNNFFSPPPPESVDLFWNNPLAKLRNVVLISQYTTSQTAK